MRRGDFPSAGGRGPGPQGDHLDGIRCRRMSRVRNSTLSRRKADLRTFPVGMFPGANSTDPPGYPTRVKLAPAGYLVDIDLTLICPERNARVPGAWKLPLKLDGNCSSAFQLTHLAGMQFLHERRLYPCPTANLGERGQTQMEPSPETSDTGRYIARNGQTLRDFRCGGYAHHSEFKPRELATGVPGRRVQCAPQFKAGYDRDAEYLPCNSASRMTSSTATARLNGSWLNPGKIATGGVCRRYCDSEMPGLGATEMEDAAWQEIRGPGSTGFDWMPESSKAELQFDSLHATAGRG